MVVHKDEREKENHREVVMYADDANVLVSAFNVSEMMGGNPK